MLQDYKLGLRMLLKYPGLTMAGGLALAVAIGVGAGWYELAGKLLSPTIPLPEGDRIVLIETQNTLTNEPELRVARDFLEWRRELRSIEDLGAYRTATRNLIVGNAPPVPIQTAELTAAAFRAARVPPLFGRALLDSDESAGSAERCRAWVRRVAALPRRPARRRRIGRETGEHTGHRDRCHAGRFRRTRSTTGLDPPATPRVVRRARRRSDQRHRQAGGRRHAGAGGRRAARAGRTGCRGASGDARASPAARDCDWARARDFRTSRSSR